MAIGPSPSSTQHPEIRTQEPVTISRSRLAYLAPPVTTSHGPSTTLLMTTAATQPPVFTYIPVSSETQPAIVWYRQAWTWNAACLLYIYTIFSCIILVLLFRTGRMDHNLNLHIRHRPRPTQAQRERFVERLDLWRVDYDNERTPANTSSPQSSHQRHRQRQRQQEQSVPRIRPESRRSIETEILYDEPVQLEARQEDDENEDYPRFLLSLPRQHVHGSTFTHPNSLVRPYAIHDSLPVGIGGDVIAEDGYEIGDAVTTPSRMAVELVSPAGVARPTRTLSRDMVGG